MIAAANALARYNGLSTVEDLSRLIGSDVAPAGPAGGTTTRRAQDSLVSGVITDIIDVASGAYLTHSLIERLNNLIEDATPEQRTALRQLIEIYYGNTESEPHFQLTVDGTVALGTRYHSIQELFGDLSSVINTAPRNPSKDAPAMSVYVSNHQYVSPASRYVNPVVIFLNSIPNIEVARAMPFMDIKFFHPRAPLSSNNQLQAPGLLRFLLGAATLNAGDRNRNADYLLATANSITGSIASTFPQTDIYSISGMEMFLSPMTLVNADETDNPTLRGNAVLDRLRPFMTFKDLDLTVVPTGGMMSYKSGRLSMILHDRSRMSEIADFIKADLYSASEIEIEYGWSHPDGITNNNENVYADIINGMRMKEKYGIINSSFTFDESGQVNITLQIAMRGGTDMSTELIGNLDDGSSSQLTHLRELQTTISTLAARLFNDTGGRSVEVRGVQVLDTLADATPTFVFTSEIVTQLAALRLRLRDNSNPEVDNLLTALTDMVGAVPPARTGEARDPSEETAIGRVRSSIIDGVRAKVEKLSTFSSNEDPFLRLSLSNPNREVNSLTTDGHRIVTTTGTERNELDRYVDRYGGAHSTGTAISGGVVSLAHLLLLFVGQPLAATGKYDEIQFLFYPFNLKAAYASKITTAAFAVDLDFFTQELIRMRLETAGNNQVMSIRDFFNFLQSRVIDDPAAFSYGLWDQTGALYDTVITDEEDRRVNEHGNHPAFQGRLQDILRTVTPNAEFSMPQLEIYVECLPGKTGTVDGETNETDAATQKSILRIHVYDRVATPYESVGQIMRAGRDGELGIIGEIHGLDTTESAVVSNNQQLFSSFVETARRTGLIERLPDGTDGAAGTDEIPALPTYRVAGGQRALKAFLYESVPYIIYGAAGTALKAANLSSMQNPELSTINMLRSPLASNVLPNGEQPGGLPMSIIPTELTVQSRGCPLISFAQQFFIDFQTGTTADNIYTVTGITHKIGQGDFTTDIKFSPLDAYGTYRNIMDRISTGISLLGNYVEARRDPETDTGENP
jgi:hypothetical protein